MLLFTRFRPIGLLATFLLLTACGNGAGTSATTATTAPAEVALPQPKPPTATGTPRILFVGNSHTAYYASIPEQFRELCEHNKVLMNGELLVEMGISLHDIYQEDQEQAEELFAKTEADGNYFDYVILQEQTPVVVDSAARYAANLKLWTDKVRRHSPRAAIYLYQLASYDPYLEDSASFATDHALMREHTLAALSQVPNAGLFRVGDAVKAAYERCDGYQYRVGGKDNLRHGENTQHLLNDGVFMASVLLYETLFGKQPHLPAEMTFSTGPGADDNGRQAL
ncbi:hypothetical protein [Hymenobacter negativus]|uniref:SGNH/GDSL hydrolase family protein n=1 Tax=Hymenobacter negativus TaxID=2795026 RepID=A0ABS3QD64_9BACT|nr:hypothetical protein [Hymenobacter negativus]MBO2008918.1 hypothetical protein [Hymenobacter negativus]